MEKVNFFEKWNAVMLSPDLPAPGDRGDAETWSWIFRVLANTGSQNRLDFVQNDVANPIVRVWTWRTVAHLRIAYICLGLYWTISLYVITISNCILLNIWRGCMIILAFYHLHDEFAFQRILFLQIARRQPVSQNIIREAYIWASFSLSGERRTNVREVTEGF